MAQEHIVIAQSAPLSGDNAASGKNSLTVSRDSQHGSRWTELSVITKTVGFRN